MLVPRACGLKGLFLKKISRRKALHSSIEKMRPLEISLVDMSLFLIQSIYRRGELMPEEGDRRSVAKIASPCFSIVGVLALFIPAPGWPADITGFFTLYRRTVPLAMAILSAITAPPKWRGDYVISTGLVVMSVFFIVVGLMSGGMCLILNGLAISLNALYVIFKATGLAR